MVSWLDSFRSAKMIIGDMGWKCEITVDAISQKWEDLFV